jgi:hypothetical protein
MFEVKNILEFDYKFENSTKKTTGFSNHLLKIDFKKLL